MSFRANHEWTRGTSLPRVVERVTHTTRRGGVDTPRIARHVEVAARIDVCPHCATLRVLSDGQTTYIKREQREEEEATETRKHRRAAARVAEPPCIEPPRFFAAPW